LSHLHKADGLEKLRKNTFFRTIVGDTFTACIFSATAGLLACTAGVSATWRRPCGFLSQLARLRHWIWKSYWRILARFD